jgi:DMSO/TMAO reductase YedYZ molybdopterin-dependent catalytic subunit
MSDSRRSPVEGTPVGRRVFLGLIAAGAGAVAAGAPLSRALSHVQRGLAVHDPTGLSALIPGGGWRYYTVTSGFPSVAPGAYSLRVAGLVANPLTLTLEDLATRPRRTIVRDFQCVTGWRVPNVRWGGVPLAALLSEARVQEAATAVQFSSFDGVYTESLTLAQAMRPDVLVAETIGGGPIPREHGGPVRMLVAPMYGYKSCKWLSEIRLVPKLTGGYWERYGYAQDGWVGRSNGRDDAPT